MGIAVMAISPTSQGDRKTYPASPSRLRTPPDPRRLARARTVSVARGVGLGAVVRATSRLLSERGSAPSGQAIADWQTDRKAAAASDGLCRPYWTFSAALISSDRTLLWPLSGT